MKKSVLITGAAGGLGKALSKAFLQKDFLVVEVDLSFAEDENISIKNGVLRLKSDVSSEESMEKCAVLVGNQLDSLDIVISNAAIFDFYSLSESGINGLKRIFDVNFFGFANTAKYFLPFLVKSKGRLVTISSESYKIPAPFQPYAVSKQSLEKLHFGVSQELMLKGISSVLIRPGAIQTNIMDETLNFHTNNMDSLFKEEFKKFIATVPKYIGKVNQPDEVAKVIFKAATSKKPKRVYKINHNPWVTLLSVLPKNIQDWSIKQQLKANSNLL